MTHPYRWSRHLARAVALACALVGRPALAAGPAPEQLFAEAQRAFDAGRHAVALEKFQTVNRLVRSPNAAFMVARSLQKLDRLPEAFEAMDAAVALATARLADDESYRATRDAAAAEREALGAALGRVVVVVADPPPALQVRLGTRRLEPSDFGRTLALRPGPVVLEATAPSRLTLLRRLSLAPGQLETVAIALAASELAPAPTATSTTLRTAGFVTAGLGTASLGISAITWVFASKRYDELVSRCGTPPCLDPNAPDLIAEGERLDLATNIALGVGVAGLVAGGTMVALGWPRTPADAAVGLRLGPSFLGVVGAF